MGNGIQQVRSHVAEMLAAAKAMLALAAAQMHSPHIERDPHARWAMESLMRTLEAHVRELAGHLERLGGTPSAVQPQGASIPPASALAVLRDCYVQLHLAHDAGLMLETNARALGYSSTAALARRHREELATAAARVRELLPESVKGEIEAEPVH